MVEFYVLIFFFRTSANAKLLLFIRQISENIFVFQQDSAPARHAIRRAATPRHLALYRRISHQWPSTVLILAVRVRDQSDRLLQRSARQRAVNLNRHASTSPQRSCARDYTNTRKFDRGLTSILHDDLHWLDLPRRVLYKICVTVYKSLHGIAPKYLAELCRPISDVQGRRHLCSAARGLLLTPRYYLSTYGRRTFSYAGPSAWDSLPEHLRAPDLTLNSFRHLMKTYLFTQMTHAAH